MCIKDEQSHTSSNKTLNQDIQVLKPTMKDYMKAHISYSTKYFSNWKLTSSLHSIK
jgi:hypothetical protein